MQAATGLGTSAWSAAFTGCDIFDRLQRSDSEPCYSPAIRHLGYSTGPKILVQLFDTLGRFPDRKALGLNKDGLVTTALLIKASEITVLDAS